jgi:hypothetical protein
LYRAVGMTQRVEKPTSVHQPPPSHFAMVYLFTPDAPIQEELDECSPPDCGRPQIVAGRTPLRSIRRKDGTALSDNGPSLASCGTGEWVTSVRQCQMAAVKNPRVHRVRTSIPMWYQSLAFVFFPNSHSLYLVVYVEVPSLRSLNRHSWQGP